MIRFLRDQFSRFSSRGSYRILVLLLLAVPSFSCSSGRNVEIAGQGVNQFHSQLNSELYEAIYAAGDEGLHKAANEEEFVAFLEAVHKKLGKVQTSQRKNFQVGMSTGQETVVTLVYNTTFNQGSGTEQFVWHIRDNQPVLLGYHISSNALILK